MTELVVAKVETRGRKPKNPGEVLTASQRTKASKEKIIAAGGILISSTTISDPELANKITKYAEQHHAHNKNEVVREALAFFFANR